MTRGDAIGLSREHRRFLILEQGVGSILVNFPLNAAIAWLSVRSMQTVPLWGMTSIAGDTLGTAFLLPVITSLVVSRVVGYHVRGGRVAALMPPPDLARSWAERTSVRRGALLGLVAMVVVALPVIVVFALAGPAEMARTPFIWFKAGFAAALGAVVTPLIAWWALADPRSVGTALRYQERRR